MLGAVKSVAVTAALRSLQELGLLTAQGSITTPGRVSSSLQLTPVHTKALLIGVMLRCLYPAILLCCIDTTLSAALIHLGTSSGSLNDILRSSYPFFNRDQLFTVHAYENADQSDPLEPRLEGHEQSHQLVLTPPYTNRLGHQALLIRNALIDIGLLQKRRDAENKSGNKWKESEDHSVHQAFAKALNFAALHDNLAIRDSKRYSWYDGDNERLRLNRSRVNSHLGNAVKRRKRRHFRNGDLIAFNIKGPKEMWRGSSKITDTTLVSPIVGILFAKEAKLAGDLIIINKSTSLRIVDHGQKLGPRNQSPVEVVFELREMLPRFIALAFAEMRDIRDIPEDDEFRDEKVASSNPIFKGEHPLREAMTQGFLKVLEADEEDWINERTLVDGTTTISPQSGGDDGDDDVVENGGQAEDDSEPNFWQTFPNEDFEARPL